LNADEQSGIINHKQPIIFILIPQSLLFSAHRCCHAFKAVFARLYASMCAIIITINSIAHHHIKSVQNRDIIPQVFPVELQPSTLAPLLLSLPRCSWPIAGPRAASEYEVVPRIFGSNFVCQGMMMPTVIGSV
jgi:hypothetical protein